MGTNVLRKELVIGIILLFISAGIFPVISGDIEYKSIIKNENKNLADPLIISIKNFDNHNNHSQHLKEPLKNNNGKSGDRLDQYQYENDDGGLPIWYDHLVEEYQWVAQSFKTTVSTLTRVKLLIFRIDNPECNLKMSIRSGINGADLVTVTKTPNQIPEWPNGQYTEFNFPDIAVTPGEEYFIICKSPEGNDYDNCYCWYFGINDPYINGEAWYSSNHGATWQIREYLPDFPENDFCFEI